MKDITVSTGFLKVGTPELVTLDLFIYPSKSGGLNHIATVLSELIEVIDPDSLIKLAEINGSKAWLQRLGFILEKIDPIDTDKRNMVVKRLEQYLKGKLKTFIPLASEMSKIGCPRLKKWMIIENTEIESDL